MKHDFDYFLLFQAALAVVSSGLLVMWTVLKVKKEETSSRYNKMAKERKSAASNMRKRGASNPRSSKANMYRNGDQFEFVDDWDGGVFQVTNV